MHQVQPNPMNHTQHQQFYSEQYGQHEMSQMNPAQYGEPYYSNVQADNQHYSSHAQYAQSNAIPTQYHSQLNYSTGQSQSSQSHYQMMENQPIIGPNYYQNEQPQYHQNNMMSVQQFTDSDYYSTGYPQPNQSHYQMTSTQPVVGPNYCQAGQSQYRQNNTMPIQQFPRSAYYSTGHPQPSQSYYQMVPTQAIPGPSCYQTESSNDQDETESYESFEYENSY